MAEHSLINTTFPVLIQEMPELRLDKPEFEARIKSLVGQQKSLPIRSKQDASESDNVRTAKIESQDANVQTSHQEETEAPFMRGLLADKSTVPSLDDQDGKMLTENADVAYRTSGEALVDLFYELEDVISATRLKEVLEKAWQDDAVATLKIIWNARSIHLGKSSRGTFYRAVGWLAENHPMTLITNLPWLVRSLIQKKAPKKEIAKDAEMVDAKDADSDFELIDEKADETTNEPKQKKLKLEEDAELVEFDIKYGVAHGYWKDLLNILALAANDQLKADGDPRKVLNVDKPTQKKKYLRDWTEGRKKATIAERHARVVDKLEKDGFYKALHLTVARLFANQLKVDVARLESEKKAEKKRITFAAKWSPTTKGMHDPHTCIVSTIAELLHPFESVCPEDVDSADRELYLKHARIAYQSQTISPLRKHLEIVERPITAEKFEEIKYERVPSLAMKRYTPLFAKKDFENFDQYIERVASGKSRISGATLLPSTLVACVLEGFYTRSTAKNANAMVEQKLKEMQLKVIDGQWNTLVQRIKDSGTLENSIAVADVSGSMGSPRFPDGTNPMSSSIGLSLLLAEITKPPFGGAFITFSQKPEVMRVGGPDDKRSFAEKVKYIERSEWGGNTDFVAVFENLILPMAIENKLSQEEMVKQLFVFSDMQFDAAGGNDRWTSSYERIQKKFKEAGYEMPRLIFWNLAGGRAGFGSTDLSDESDDGDDVAPKPVTAAEENTALVSGYSQGQMKMFLEGGSFEEPEEEQEIVEEEEEGEGGEVILKKQKKKQDPLAVVKKAISHEAYRMLKVVD